MDNPDYISTLPNDMIIYIALELDLPVLVNWCSLSNKFKSVTCDNNIFWYNRFKRDFPDYVLSDKPKNITWKKFYKDYNERYLMITIDHPCSSDMYAVIFVDMLGNDKNFFVLREYLNFEGHKISNNRMTEEDVNIYAINNKENMYEKRGDYDYVHFLKLTGKFMLQNDDLDMDFCKWWNINLGDLQDPSWKRAFPNVKDLFY